MNLCKNRAGENHFSLALFFIVFPAPGFGTTRNGKIPPTKCPSRCRASHRYHRNIFAFFIHHAIYSGWCYTRHGGKLRTVPINESIRIEFEKFLAITAQGHKLFGLSHDPPWPAPQLCRPDIPGVGQRRYEPLQCQPAGIPAFGP